MSSSSEAPDVSLQVVRVTSANVPSTSTCSCRFGPKCLQIILDSGASRHIVGNKEYLTEVHPIPPLGVVNAFGSNSVAKYAGTLRIMLTNNILVSIEDVLVCSQVCGILLSVQELVKAGYEVCVNSAGAHLKADDHLIYTTKYTNGAYVIHATRHFSSKQVVKVRSLTFSTDDLWHARFGHASRRYLQRLGLPVKHLQYCVACSAAKQKRKPKSSAVNPTTTPLFVAKTVLEKLHYDTVGPFVKSLDNKRYLLLVVDSFSSYGWALPVGSKHQIGKMLIHLHRYLSNVFKASLKCVMSDNGTEFKNDTLITYWNTLGVKREYSTPDQPNENGKIERFNDTIQKSMKCCLSQAIAPKFFWSYAAVYATCIWNCLPRKGMRLSPYQMVHHIPPPVHRFRVFGAKGFTLNHRKADKLDLGHPIIFLGLDMHSDGSVAYFPKQRTVRVIRDFKLDEMHLLHKAHTRFHRHCTLPVSHTTRVRHFNKPLDVSAPSELSVLLDDDDSEVISPPHPRVPETTTAQSNIPSSTASTDVSLSYDQPHLDEISADNIIPTLRRNKGIRTLRVTSMIYAYRVAITATTLPPKSYKHISGRPDEMLWKQAYFEEIHSLETTGHMQVVPRPLHEKIIPILEIFTTKKDSISGLWKAKSRIVARGDLQFTPTTFFAPVASVVALRIFILFSSRFPGTIHQLDVKTAFLYGRLSHPIYLDLPVGHPQKAGRSRVWKTSTAIYGLVEAPQVWNNTIHRFLADFGCRALISERCLYLRNSRFQGGNRQHVEKTSVNKVCSQGCKSSITKSSTTNDSTLHQSHSGKPKQKTRSDTKSQKQQSTKMDKASSKKGRDMVSSEKGNSEASLSVGSHTSMVFPSLSSAEFASVRHICVTQKNNLISNDDMWTEQKVDANNGHMRQKQIVDANSQLQQKELSTVKIPDVSTIDLLLLLYVDDILYIGTEMAIKEFEQKIHSTFKIKSTKWADTFIGIEISQDPKTKTISLCQHEHISKAVQKFDLLDARQVSTPLDLNCLQVTDSPYLEDPKLYQQLVGTLNYLAGTCRPDIAFAVGHLARYAKSPTKFDMKKAKRCLTYLRDTARYSLYYSRLNLPIKVQVYVDSSFANGEDAKSIYGFVIFVDNKLVHYRSKTEPYVTTSSTEAEFVALSLTIQEISWILGILEQLGAKAQIAVIFCDNQGAIKIATNQSSTGRTKHINIRLQYAKQEILTGRMELRYVQSSDNLADVFTKPLGRIAFHRLVNRMLKSNPLESDINQ